MKSILSYWKGWFCRFSYMSFTFEKGYELFVIDSFINSNSKSIEKIISILKNMNKYVHEKNSSN